MAGRWLRTAEVVRWWGDPMEQIALLTEDLNEPLMLQWIVEHWRRPFAYVQAYPVDAWPQTHLLHLPEGTEVIDVFIGEPAMVGNGHGSRFLRTMAEKLLAEGATTVAVDPACDNHRARRAYARAGFVGEETFETEEGPVVLMVFASKSSGPRGRPPLSG
jgi:RimJ/RimL family protein N-acetyltransferase